eukprot:364743-Chlamydomonas_euryale.AAC.97
MGVPNADLVGRRGTGRAGVAPNACPRPLRRFTLGQVCTGAGPRPRGRPFSLPGPMTAQDIVPARLPPLPPPSTSSPATTNGHSQRPASSKRAKVIHYMHAMQTLVLSLGLIGMLRLSGLDWQATARMERSGRHALACRD